MNASEFMHILAKQKMDRMKPAEVVQVCMCQGSSNWVLSNGSWEKIMTGDIGHESPV